MPGAALFNPCSPCCRNPLRCICEPLPTGPISARLFIEFAAVLNTFTLNPSGTNEWRGTFSAGSCLLGAHLLCIFVAGVGYTLYLELTLLATGTVIDSYVFGTINGTILTCHPLHLLSNAIVDFPYSIPPVTCLPVSTIQYEIGTPGCNFTNLPSVLHFWSQGGDYQQPNDRCFPDHSATDLVYSTDPFGLGVFPAGWSGTVSMLDHSPRLDCGGTARIVVVFDGVYWWINIYSGSIIHVNWQGLLVNRCSPLYLQGWLSGTFPLGLSGIVDWTMPGNGTAGISRGVQVVVTA